MSTETAERADSASGDDEEWLYGDDDDNDPVPNDDDDDKTETEVFSALVGDVEDVNGVCKQDAHENSESDSDDDVCVTIGDIKTGGNQSNTSVSLNIKASSRATTSGLKAREVDLDGVGTAVLEADGELMGEKPWRKPGADLSDYFNYGFNEDTWKTYCDKQRKLRMSLEVMTLGSSSKVMVNCGELSNKPDHSSKNLNSSINVIGGETGNISRVEGRRRHDTDGNNTQVQSSEQLSGAELQSSKLPPFFPPNIPPPPFPLHSISSTAPPLIPPPPRLHMTVPPPGFPLPPGVPSPPSMITTLDSSRSGGSYDGRSTPSFPFPAGVYPPVVGGVAPWPGLIDNAKAWDYYSHQDKQREREREDRKRTRDRERERNKDRERDREREHPPSNKGHSSDEELGRREHGDRERERHRERPSRDGEREDRYRDRRHRDRNERHKSSHSSYSRRHASDEGESHRRHRHKRSRRNRDGTEPSEGCSAEHKNQSEPTE